MGLLARVMSIRGVAFGLHERNLPDSPFPLFDSWYRTARRARVYWYNAMALATAGADGTPSCRMVLLKSYNDRGFVFYTNYDSRKGRELDANPRASLVLYWNELVRQIRITGKVEKTSREESEAYFHSRPRGSQTGAWASNQDTVMADREELMERFRQFDEKFKGRDVPLPEYWGGYRVIPDEIEFWQGRTYRLHDRFRYLREGKAWTRQRISP